MAERFASVIIYEFSLRYSTPTPTNRNLGKLAKGSITVSAAPPPIPPAPRIKSPLTGDPDGRQFTGPDPAPERNRMEAE